MIPYFSLKTNLQITNFQIAIKMIIKFYLPFPKEFFNKSVRVGPEQPQIIVTNIRGETKRLFKEGYDGAMEICHVTGIGTACGAII